MHDRLKTYFTRYSGTVYIMLAILIIACGWFIFGGSNDSDYQRATDSLERAQEQQRKSLEFNQAVKTSIERSEQLNQQASERVKEGTRRLDEAERFLERNEQIIRDVEQRYQAQPANGTAITSPKKHLGSD